MGTTKTANDPKLFKTTRKPSETTQIFLQPTTNYAKLAIISLKPPEITSNQPLNAFS